MEQELRDIVAAMKGLQDNQSQILEALNLLRERLESVERRGDVLAAAQRVTNNSLIILIDRVEALEGGKVPCRQMN